MKNNISKIIKQYLGVYPEEQQKLLRLINHINNYEYEEFIDWNNFNGHIVCSGFIYAEKEQKFLVLYHKDLKKYLYPGGHMDSGDIDTLYAAKREVREETGLNDLKQYVIDNNPLIPIDIDIHKIGYNERLELPEHYHFDFRYLFLVDNISEVKIDSDELSDYKWVNIEQLESSLTFDGVLCKIKKLLKNNEFLN